MPVPKNVLTVAIGKAKELGVLKHSISKGKGNVYGFVGEECTYSHLLQKFVDIKKERTYDYDLLLNNKLRIDVKTKTTSAIPKPEYDCSVASYNPKQKCDAYMFCRVHLDLKTAWILGWLTKDEFFNKAEYWEKGRIDPTNGYTVKADCYNVKIGELNPIEELTNYGRTARVVSR